MRVTRLLVRCSGHLAVSGSFSYRTTFDHLVTGCVTTECLLKQTSEYQKLSNNRISLITDSLDWYSGVWYS